MAITHKDINLLTQKSSVAGTEKLPVSDTEYITPSQIVGGYLPLAGGTMANTNVVTNLNADLLDGKSDGELTARYFATSLLTSSDNANSLTPGIYAYVNANNPSNTPSGVNNCLLLDFASSGRSDKFQFVYSVNSGGIYTRYRVASEWTNWVELVKAGGTSAQFIKGDGSLDSNTYATTTDLANAVGNIETLLAAI